MASRTEVFEASLRAAQERQTDTLQQLLADAEEAHSNSLRAAEERQEKQKDTLQQLLADAQEAHSNSLRAAEERQEKQTNTLQQILQEAQEDDGSTSSGRVSLRDALISEANAVTMMMSTVTTAVGTRDASRLHRGGTIEGTLLASDSSLWCSTPGWRSRCNWGCGRCTDRDGTTAGSTAS